MLKRKFYDKLLEWKQSHKKECLLVNGARQVGKTFIIDYFAKENYSSYIYLNLFKNPEFSEIFEGSIDAYSIFKRLAIFGVDANIIEGDTLLFIDEIQRCPKARTALKFLAMEPSIDVIASGSLFGLHYRKNSENIYSNISIPVGYEREMTMFSLDFEEFLWAKGIDENTIDALFEHYKKKIKVPAIINEKFQGLIREYMVVGGMPEVLNVYLETNSLEKVFNEQQKIKASYEDDIQMYATNSDKPKIKACYESLPRQLAKENTKFKYSDISRGGNARKYSESIDWLLDAALVYQVKNVSLPQMPLKAYEIPQQFKLYGSDIGIVTSMFGFETQKALLNDTLTGHAKGGIYENLIFDILNKRGFILNYYKKGEGSQEIEFVFERQSSVIPIEVKSKRGDTISLNSFIKEFSPPYSIKLIDGNIGVSDLKITLPHYMAMFI